MCEKHYIYGLVDPVSSCIRYIGRAVNPRSRLNAHLCEKGDNKKCQWIAELSRQGKKPTMVILEETDAANVRSAETKWIEKLSVQFGWKLVNTLGVPDNYEDEYNYSKREHAMRYEDWNNLIFPEKPATGAYSYPPGYLLDKLRNNFYRPFFQDGELVMLTRSRENGYADITIVSNHPYRPMFSRHWIKIKFSELPSYAIASLPDGYDYNGGSLTRHRELRGNKRNDYMEWCEDLIAEMEAPYTTGRTFFAAL